jgi:hypothetical protein
MTIIETVHQEVDRILKSKKKFYLISDFGIKTTVRDYSTHAGKVFRNYIRSLGYVMVSANTVDLTNISKIVIRGNRTIIMSNVNYELYRKETDEEIINRKATKKALLEALTTDDVEYIKEVITAKIDFLLKSLQNSDFHYQLRTELYYRAKQKRLPKIDRIEHVVNNYVNTLL